jgi:hypothetical protein
MLCRAVPWLPIQLAPDDCDLEVELDKTGIIPLGFRLTSQRVSLLAFAEAFCGFRGIDFATRLRWLFDLLKSRAIAGGANNLSQHFTRSFHRDQSLKTKPKLNQLREDSG